MRLKGRGWIILAVVLVISLFATNAYLPVAQAEGEEKEQLILAINATFPPFESVGVTDDGKKEYAGIDIDIANYIGEQLGIEFVIEDMQFNGLVTALSTGRADVVISGISPTAERLEKVDFSEPYFYPQTAIITAKNSELGTLNALEGKKIGVSMGTTYASQAKDVKDAQVVELDSTPLVIQELNNGRIDAGLFDGAQAAEFVKENLNLEMHLLPSSKQLDESYAIAFPKGSKWTEPFNEVLAEMRTNGELDRIFAKWLGDEFVAQNQSMEKETLTLAINATFPPFESVSVNDNGEKEYVGIDLEIANYIGEQLGIEFVVEDMQFNGLVTALTTGRADVVISGISPTEERLEKVDFSEPYFYPQTAIVSKKGSQLSTLALLEGKKIGVSMGTTYAYQAQGVEGAEVVELDSTPLVIQELNNGRIDAGLFDGAQAAEFVKANSNLEMHLLPSEKNVEDSYAIAFPKGSEWIGPFNDVLAEMEKNGQLDQIFAKWLGNEFVTQNENIEEGFRLDFSALSPYLPLLTESILVTLKFTFLSTILGFVWGTLLSLIKVSRFKPIAWLGMFYTSFFRGTPLLVQLMLIYFATPQITGYNITALEAGVLTFGLNSAAYISESIRGGILSIDKGQWEASMALGIPKYKMMMDIIFPQAIKNILPSLVNESIALLKDSSMIALIGVNDTLRWAQQVQAKTFSPFEAFIVTALVYYILVMLLTLVASYLERRVRVSD